MILLYIAIIILIFIILYIIFPFLIKKLLRMKFLTNIGKEKYIYLTFDDGPDPVLTPKILEILKKADIKATFFLLGRNIDKYPDLVDRILENGHEIGEHGYGHLHPWKSNPFNYLLDLVKSHNIIKKYFKSPKCITFRPPFGKLNILTLFYIWIMKKKVAFWNIDPKDFMLQSGKDVAEEVLGKIQPGSVILLHDGRIKKGMSDKNVTISALEQILVASNQYFTYFSTINKIIYT